MALTVGTDSYITIEEAGLYFASYYASTDVKLVAWEELEDSDKEIYLRRAFRSIETLPLKGCKYSATQTTQFPRDNSIDLAVPTAVKNAQAEISLSYLQIDTGVGLNADTLERQSLQAQGVTKIKIGKLEETYDLSRVSTKSNTYQALELSENAQLYLIPWLRGGYDVYGVSKTASLI
jgi:hypothetical protein